MSSSVASDEEIHRREAVRRPRVRARANATDDGWTMFVGYWRVHCSQHFTERSNKKVPSVSQLTMVLY
jgi:hypothetical protein